MILWLALALKVPIVALLYLVWWAIKDPPVSMVDEATAARPTATRGRTRATVRRTRRAAARTARRSPSRPLACAWRRRRTRRRILR